MVQPQLSTVDQFHHMESSRENIPRKRCIRVAKIILVVAVLIGLLIISVITVVVIHKTTKDLNEDFMTTAEPRYGFHAQSFLDKPRLLAAIPVDGFVYGLTVLNSKLYVTRGYGLLSQVKVYDTMTFTFSRNITIPGSSDLNAIVASPRYNNLYISTPLMNVVYLYNLSTNVVTQWEVGGECYGLFLTTTGNVLVTIWNTGRVEEYTPDGRLIREIRLDTSIENPRHSVQLSSDRLVVSHGGSGSLHRVCIVDMNGRLIQCYGESRGSRVGQLNNPRHMVVDRYGNVLVADWLNNRVVLLSPALTYLGSIAVPGHQLSYPSALHLDQLNLRLYIGESSTERVSVFGVNGSVNNQQ